MRLSLNRKCFRLKERAMMGDLSMQNGCGHGESRLKKRMMYDYKTERRDHMERLIA